MERSELCDFCDQPLIDHEDAWGRHVPCYEQIIGTITAREFVETDWRK